MGDKTLVHGLSKLQKIEEDNMNEVGYHIVARSSTAANTGLAKVAVQCSADTFVVNQSLVLRINICGKNRHLRQARNRYW
jgi:NADP-dependent 3-hydroxy acid dehydrogenase YdfG